MRYLFVWEEIRARVSALTSNSPEVAVSEALIPEQVLFQNCNQCVITGRWSAKSDTKIAELAGNVVKK
jgi:hypothetical protein